MTCASLEIELIERKSDYITKLNIPMSFEPVDNRQLTVVYSLVNLEVHRSVKRGSFA